MNSSKAAIVVSQIIEKIELILGGGWAALCALVLLITIVDTPEDGGTIISFIICLALGVLVLLKGFKRKKMRLTFKKYVAQLSADPTGSIENIAGATGNSVDVVKKNLQYMIKKKYFTNAYFDEQNNQLVLPSMVQHQQNVNDYSQTSNVSDIKLEMTTCNCPNCGGINKIAKGKVAECDFCGSPING